MAKIFHFLKDDRSNKDDRMHINTVTVKAITSFTETGPVATPQQNSYKNQNCHEFYDCPASAS